MLFCDIDILTPDGRVEQHRYVGTKGTRIAYVGESIPEDPEQYGQRYAGAGRLLMPGLYNTHAHNPMSLLRGYAENLPLDRWLNESVFPFEARMTPEDSYWGTLVSLAEGLRFGTVSFSDMYFHPEPRIQAVTETGIKANISGNIVAIGDGTFADNTTAQENDAIARTFGHSPDGKLRIDYALHAEYTTGPTIAAEAAQHAKDQGLIIQVHVSETKKEHEECKQRHNGMTPIQYFESLGVLDVPVIAAHCVWVEPADIEIMAAKGVSVGSCPASNMKLGSGFVPVGQMLAAGVNYCLGTDGPASNNNLDLMQDMTLLALIAKGSTNDPTNVTPWQIVKAATRNGALAQGRTDCGFIQEGFAADLVVLDTTGPSWYPRTDMVNNLVYAGHGSDVVLTMVDGQVLYRDGEWPTIDLERAKFEVCARSKRIMAEV